MTLYLGKVVRIVHPRGFGFIQSDPQDAGEIGNVATAEEFFFHVSGMVEPTAFVTLQEGDRVSFAPTDTPKGRRAEEIRVMHRGGQ